MLIENIEDSSGIGMNTLSRLFVLVISIPGVSVLWHHSTVYEQSTPQKRQKYNENTVVKHRLGLQWNTAQKQPFTIK